MVQGWAGEEAENARLFIVRPAFVVGLGTFQVGFGGGRGSIARRASMITGW